MTVAVKNNNKVPLVVPPAVRRKAGFKSGEEIEFRASGGRIIILPKLPTATDEYTPAQRRAIDARLAKSDLDIQQGRMYGPFDTAEHMAASIEMNLKKLRATKRKAAPVR
jgi:bifunctional DNA-binding transcriptional regulator/antitoxin component of YhaV-PrlF toxin-antitoxin module